MEFLTNSCTVVTHKLREHLGSWKFVEVRINTICERIFSVLGVPRRRKYENLQVTEPRLRANPTNHREPRTTE